MTKLAPFLLINLAFVLTNIVGAGVLMVGHAVLGDSKSILLWLVIGLTAIACAVIFLRGALETCRGIAARIH